MSTLAQEFTAMQEKIAARSRRREQAIDCWAKAACAVGGEQFAERFIAGLCREWVEELRRGIVAGQLEGWMYCGSFRPHDPRFILAVVRAAFARSEWAANRPPSNPLTSQQPAEPAGVNHG